ncbi:RNA-binding protein 25-like [Penaeus chinensis]|uniref:RNA-binding protein 25-like n=1 Tax=Penaeus chinensis TaxID=139456 RepID=UPI001FB85FD0|nr:RNA-binding protein 25-like [Penaeus chinensis]
MQRRKQGRNDATCGRFDGKCEKRERERARRREQERQQQAQREGRAGRREEDAAVDARGKERNGINKREGYSWKSVDRLKTQENKKQKKRGGENERESRKTEQKQQQQQQKQESVRRAAAPVGPAVDYCFMLPAY